MKSMRCYVYVVLCDARSGEGCHLVVEGPELGARGLGGLTDVLLLRHRLPCVRVRVCVCVCVCVCV